LGLRSFGTSLEFIFIGEGCVWLFFSLLLTESYSLEILLLLMSP